MIDTHIGNGTGHRPVIMAAPLVVTSGPVRYEAVLHSCGTIVVEGGGYLPVPTHGNFIVLLHWGIRPPTP